MAGVFFLLELALLGAAGRLALAGIVAFGGARRNGAGLLATGLYALVAGLALSIVPGRSPRPTMRSSGTSCSRWAPCRWGCC